jgi:hypothetical protein
MRVLFLLLLVVGFLGCDDSNRSSNSSEYTSDSPYAPSAQTRHGINQLEGTASQKADAMRAVERFNKAAASRGERPTGL